MKTALLATALALACAAAFAEMVVTTKDGRVLRVPVDSPDIARIEFTTLKAPSAARRLGAKTVDYGPCDSDFARISDDLVVDVGMGACKWGFGYAGIELEGIQHVRIELLSTSASFKSYDGNAFAGFTADYRTPSGWTRVQLGIGPNERGRFGDSYYPDIKPANFKFVDLGAKASYDLDLKTWAPQGWDGKVVVGAGIQNAGENNSFMARLILR